MIVGIDPGAKGAIAVLSYDGTLHAAHDMPVIAVNGKARLNAAELARLLGECTPHVVMVERVGAMPGQGVSSMFAFGYGAGVIEGVCAGLSLPMEFVTPAVWKRRLGLSSYKGASRMLACRLWPAMSHLFARVKDEGRCEAALLAYYQRTQWQAKAA